MAERRGEGAELDRVRQRFERWRQRQGGPGRPIPESLWAEAASVAQVEGVAATARALRVDRWRLERRTEIERSDPLPAARHDDEVAGVDGSTGFVEVDTSRLWLSPRTVLRFESRDGERLHVELSGATAVDVVALAEAFWTRRG